MTCAVPQVTVPGLETAPAPSRPLKIYVAGSWRHMARVRHVVDLLRHAGHLVFDFTRPDEAQGFSWSEVDEHWRAWSPAEFQAGLAHPRAKQAFAIDMAHLRAAEVTVLVLPSGKSAHLELGYAVGAQQWTAILLDGGLAEAELMYATANLITTDTAELLHGLARVSKRRVDQRGA